MKRSQPLTSMDITVTSGLRIVLLGYIVRGPIGGMTWSELQYLLGLARLGHDVYFVEDSDDYPSCYDPSRHTTDSDPSYGLRYVATTLGRFGMGDRWAFHDAHTARWHGPLAGNITQVCRTADVLINLGGVNPLRPWFADIPIRILIDKDPVFTQIHNATIPEKKKFCSNHTSLFSFAENIGLPSARVPDDGLRWHPTRHPIVLDMVEVTPGPPNGHFTTVMQWESYRALSHCGRRYGMKSESFLPYLHLPQRASGVLELALGSPSAPRDLLTRHGWRLCDPLEVTRDASTYLRYIRASKGEFSVAKQGYVDTYCGWFSERSATYLASGRPVIVQETGFSSWLQGCGGVLSFTNPDEAEAALEEITTRYDFHCHAARAVAEEYFDGRKILPSILDRAMSPDAITPCNHQAR